MKSVIALSLLASSVSANVEQKREHNPVIEVFNCTTVTAYLEDDSEVQETTLTKIISSYERIEVHYKGVPYIVTDLDHSGSWAYGKTDLYSITYSPDAKKGYLHLESKSVMFDTSKSNCFKG